MCVRLSAAELILLRAMKSNYTTVLVVILAFVAFHLDVRSTVDGDIVI